MNRKHILPIKYEYDIENDILFLFDEKSENYGFSEFLDKNTIINFNNHNIPTGFEIIDASYKFNTKKHFLKNLYCGNIYLKISEEFIYLNIDLTVKIHNKDTPLPFKFQGINDNNISNFEAEKELIRA
ncbi:MAG: DUF2283 domain-containing protein [Methanobacteriaceae archaeon]